MVTNVHLATSQEVTSATALVEYCRLPVCATTAVAQPGAAAGPRAGESATEGDGKGQSGKGNVPMPIDVPFSAPEHPGLVRLSRDLGHQESRWASWSQSLALV